MKMSITMFPNKTSPFYVAVPIPMKVTCQCGALYQLSEKLAGKKVKCKKCGHRFQIPDPSATAKGTLSTSKKPRRKTAEEIKREKEDALLAQYEKQTKKKQSVEDFIAENFRDGLTEDKHTQAIGSIAFGVICFACAVTLFWYMYGVEDGDIVPKVIFFLMLIGGVWWLPPLIFAIGMWRLVTGIQDLRHVYRIRKSRKKAAESSDSKQ